MKIDAIPKVQSPIRRFIARIIDLAIYSSAVSMLMMLCNVNIERGGRLLSLVISLLAMALMIAIEPILLHFLGTTPGKYIFGLYVVDIDGSKIDYLDALSRTCNVCFYGLGFNVPVISLYRLWKSYKACDECEELPWEYESELQQKRPAFLNQYLRLFYP